MFGRKIAPMIKKAVASGAASKAAPRGRGLSGVLQGVAALATKKVPAAILAAAQKAPAGAAGRTATFKKGGAVKKSSDAMGRAVKRKTADVKGRAMKKGK